MAQDIQTLATPERQVAPPKAAAAPVRKNVAVQSAELTVRKTRLAGEDRQRLIAETAYFRAEQRGFAPGQELEDWLAAEIEIDTLFDDET